MYLSILGMMISLINLMCFTCLCGHTSFDTLPGSFIGASATWYVFIKKKKVGDLRRVVIAIFCIATTVILIKNGCDILWFGHEPLLP